MTSPTTAIRTRENLSSTLASAAPLLDAGADSLAVLSALFDAPDIRTAAHGLNQLFATESEE